MKTELSQLTVSEFISLMCGEHDVLLAVHEIVSPKKTEEVMRNIASAFKEISDPAGFKTFQNRMADYAKARLKRTLFTMCRNLIDIGHDNEVKEALMAYGINALKMDDNRLKTEVDMQLARAKKVMEGMKTEEDAVEQTPQQIRRHFDEMTASLMGHFKFQINTDVMKASEYALLIARMDREIKAQLTALRKKR